VSAKVRVWHLAPIVAGVTAWLFLQLPPGSPPPPDFTDQAFTSVRVELRGLGCDDSGLSVASNDRAVCAGLAEVLRSGQPVVVCRCATLGSLEFRRPDGSAERVLLMPAHDDGSVEFRFGQGRYRVNRERFLGAVVPLGVPAARWYKFPDAKHLSSPPDLSGSQGKETAGLSPQGLKGL